MQHYMHGIPIFMHTHTWICVSLIPIECSFIIYCSTQNCMLLSPWLCTICSCLALHKWVETSASSLTNHDISLKFAVPIQTGPFRSWSSIRNCNILPIGEEKYYEKIGFMLTSWTSLWGRNIWRHELKMQLINLCCMLNTIIPCFAQYRLIILTLQYLNN